MVSSSMMAKLITDQRSRILVPLAAFLICGGIAFAVISTTTATYKASARLWVQPREKKDKGEGDGGPEVTVSPLIDVPNLSTFCEIAKSQAVLQLATQEVAKRLPPDKWQPGQTIAGVTVTPVADSNVITLEYTSDDSEVATAVVDAVISGLLQENDIQVSGPLQRTRKRLEQQLGMAQKEYEKTKSGLLDFQHSNQSVDFDQESSGLSAARSDLSGELHEAKKELIALDDRLACLHAQLGVNPEEVLDFEKISSDEVVQKLRENIATTEVSLVEMKSKYTDNHPKVKRLKLQLHDGQHELEERCRKLIGRADARFTSMSPDNEVQRKLLDDMLLASTDRSTWQAKIVHLNGALADIDQELAGIPAKQRELETILRKDDQSTRALAAIEGELQRVNLTESVALPPARLHVIDPTKVRPARAALGWPVALLVGIVAAVASAVLMRVLDPRLMSLRQAASFAEILIGWIPDIEKSFVSDSAGFARLRICLQSWLDTDKVFWISSADDGDGKSFLSYGLAAGFAEAGLNVVLIDADFVKPTLHLKLEETASPGLAQFIRSECSDAEIIKEVRSRLRFIPAGGVGLPAEHLSSAKFRELLQQLRSRFDVVIVDSTAAGHESGLQVPDTDINLLVIASIKHTLKHNLDLLRSQIDLMPFKNIGFVINRLDGKSASKMVSRRPTAQVEQAVAAGVAQPSSESNW